MEEDGRQFPRVPSRHAVLVKKLGDESLEGFASTKSVGLGGCSFLTEEPPGVGAVLDILISIEHTVARAKARVVYENALDGGRYEVGVAFVELSDDDRDRIQSIFAASAESDGSD